MVSRIDSLIKHPKRPRDPAQLAKLMIDIASGEVEDRELTPEEQGKDPAAVALGSIDSSRRSVPGPFSAVCRAASVRPVLGAKRTRLADRQSLHFIIGVS